MQYQELTEKIIGCAYRVYNKMGFGFLESVYEKCLQIELQKAGLKAQFQHPITLLRWQGGWRVYCRCPGRKCDYSGIEISSPHPSCA